MAAISKDKKMEIKEDLFSNKDLEELCRHINNRNRVRGIFNSLTIISFANRISTLLCSRTKYRIFQQIKL